MIAKVRGVLAGWSKRGVLIEVGGLTYEVCLTALTREKFAARPAGEEVSLYTLYCLENSSAGGWLYPLLIGFEDEREREFFSLFTSVENVGVKTALAAMTLPVEEIARAIERADVQTLKKLKGIGERTARKIVAALGGRVAAFAGEPSPGCGERDKGDKVAAGGGQFWPFAEDAAQILLQLGYSQTEAKKMVRDALGRNSSIQSAEALLEEIFKGGKGSAVPTVR